MLIGDAVMYATYEPERKTPWKPRCLAATAAVINGLFVLSSGAALAFGLFFDGFLISVWPSLFASIIALFSVSLAAGLVGIFGQCFRYHAVALGIFTFLVCGQIACVSIALTFVVDEHDTLSGVESEWRKDIASGGDDQRHICDIQRLFSCSGWNAVCPAMPSDEELEKMIDEVRSMKQLLASGALGALSSSTGPSHGFGDGNITTDTPSPVDMTTCPVCVESTEVYNVSCRSVLEQKLDDAQPGVIAAHALYCALSLLSVIVIWCARHYDSAVRTSSASYNSPSRYL